MSSCATSWRARARSFLLGLAASASLLGLTVAGLPAAYGASVAQQPVSPSASSQRSDDTSKPSIIGTAQVGSTVKLSLENWPGRSGEFDTYHGDVLWNAGGTTIRHATFDFPHGGSGYADSFTLPASAAGKRLVAVIQVFPYGTNESYTATTPGVSVAHAKFSKVTTPAIAGSAKVGSTLKVRTGSWSPKASFAYQLLRNGKAIKGATRSSYKATATDLSKRVSVRTTTTNVGYARQTKTSSAVKIGYGSFVKTTAPKVSGTAVAGKRLSAKVGGWSPKATFSYQWLRGGKAIRGAKRSTYRLTAADIGKRVAVRVTGRNKGYKNTSRTSGAKKIGAYRFAVKKRPSISGSRKAGATLTAKRPVVSPRASKYSYRWLRNGKAIRGATKSTFKVRSGDKGAKISVRVSALRKHYTTVSSTSKTVKIYKPVKKRSWAYPDDWGECPASHPVKGNQSGIYHVPGGRWYDVTTAEECFSSAAAARSAGYRASRNG